MSKKQKDCIFNDNWLLDTDFRNGFRNLILNGKDFVHFVAKIFTFLIWVLQH